jgi:plasmid replication initiation protein
MNIISVEDNKNNIIKKHNELVKKARYSLSEQGIKLVSMLISMIRIDDKDFQEYHLQVKDFAIAINSSSNDIFKQVDKLTEDLMSKPFKIGDEKFNWCYYARYRQGEAHLVLKIAPELKPYLLELKEDFLEYNIKDILMLKSAYVIRLYELITMEWNQYKHYNPNAKSFTFELEIEELKKLFEIPLSYLYKDIRVNIIDKAVKQFEEKTNIKFTYEEQKLGKKVVRLQIKVSENNKGSNDIFASRKAFISYIRKEYKPNPDKKIFPIVISTKTGDVKVNLNGEIYISGDDIKTLDNKQADKLWDWLYELVKNKPDLLQNPNQKNLFS